MEKVIVFLRRHETETVGDFRKRYLGEHAKRVLAESGAVRYYANVVEDASDVLTPELFSTPYPGVDAVDELWFESGGVLALPALYDREKEVVEAYRVEERIMQYCPPRWPKGERSPWFKRINFLRRKEGISFEQFSAHWRDIHGPLALRIHNTVQYIQNLIVDSLTDRKAEWDGIVQLDFRSKDQFVNGLYAFPDSKQLMFEDIRKFTADTDKPRLSLILGEYVMRD
jgi:uncharacterized protein (TIGR02118 family)